MSSRSVMLMQALRDLGHEVLPVAIASIGPDGEEVPHSGPWARFRWKIGYPKDPTQYNETVRSCFSKNKYDVLWVTKALALHPATLRQARMLQPSVRLIWYSEDDMMARHNQSRYFIKGLPLYDVVITTKSFNCEPHELPALGARRIVFMDKCFDRQRHRPIEVSMEDRRNWGGKVGFVGTFEHDRAEQMLFIAKNGIRIRVWGNGWPEGWAHKHPNLTVERRPVLGEDYPRTLCSTDINLCFLRKANRDLQTDRTVEIPACGAFMLAERTAEHQRLFKEGIEAEFFGNREELLGKIRLYQAFPDRRAAVAAAGRQRCLNDGYSFHDRLAVLMKPVVLAK